MNPGKSEHLLSMLRYGWGWWVHGDWEQQEQEDDDDGNLKFLVDKEREWERRDRADNERRWRGCGKNNDNFETQRANFSINLNSRAPLVLRCRSIWIIISLLLLGNCWTSSSTHFFSSTSSRLMRNLDKMLKLYVKFSTHLPEILVASSDMMSWVEWWRPCPAVMWWHKEAAAAWRDPEIRHFPSHGAISLHFCSSLSWRSALINLRVGIENE